MKLRVEHTEHLKEVIDLLVKYYEHDRTIELALPFILYCFYIQFQNYHSELYKNYENPKYNVYNYIQNNTKNYKKCNKIMSMFIGVIQEVFIWLIFVLLFLTITLFKQFIYFTFGIKMIMFFFIMYKFLMITKDSGVLKYIWIFIIYAGVNTLIVYFYQFISLDIVGNWYHSEVESHYPIWLKDNLKTFGFEKYERNNMSFSFLPHYASNLLSVVLLWEIRRIILNKQQGKPVNINNSYEMASKNESEDKKSKSNKLYLKDDKSSYSVRSKRKILSVSYFKYFAYKFLILACKTYWLMIFLSICAIIISYQLSLSMLSYIIVFCISFILMFRKIVNSVDLFLERKTKFFISKLIRYNLVEMPYTHEIQSRYRIITFKLLLITSMVYITAIYFYSIFDIIQNVAGSYPIFTEEHEEIIKSIAYLIGVFHEVDYKSFLSSIWGHLIMIILISLDIYVQKLQNYLMKMIVKMDKVIKLNHEIKREQMVKNMKRFFGQNYDDGKSEMQSAKSDIQLKISLESKQSNILPGRTTEFEFERNQDVNISIRSRNHSIRSALVEVDKDIESCPNLARFLNIFKKIENSNKQPGQISAQNKDISLEFRMGTKKFLEEIIIYVILLSAIVKLNIISIAYIITVVILQCKGMNMRRILNIAIFISVLTMVQISLFISNLNYETDPMENLAMLNIIKRTLYIPWYTMVLKDSWGFFLSLGVSNYQLRTLWVEFVVLLLCFIYLDFFSYSIYYQTDDTKINYYNLKQNAHVKRVMTNMTEQEYEHIRENIKYTFKIEIVPYLQIRDIFNLDKDKIRSLRTKMIDSTMYRSKINREGHTGKCVRWLMKIKKALYLTMHNITLVLTLILSMMNSGLISIIYIVISLIFLYKSNNIVLAKKYALPRVISHFLRIFLLIDLLIQCIYQAPFNTYITTGSTLDLIIDSIGIKRIILYDKPDPNTKFFIVSDFMILDNLKALTYLLLSIQVMIYNSNDFKNFYVKFILKKKASINKNSLINAFLFNNIRIKQMNEVMDNRTKINKILDQLEVQLENWDFKLTAHRMEDENKCEEENDKNQSELEMRDKIRHQIMKGSLIKIAVYIHRKTTSYTFVDKENKQELEFAILKGDTYIKSFIERKVDEFIDQLDLKDIQLEEIKEIIKEKNKAIQKAEKNESDDEEEEEIGEANDELKVIGGDIENKPMVENAITNAIKEETKEIHELQEDEVKLLHPNKVEEIGAEKQEVKTKLDKIDIKKYNNILNSQLFKKYLTTGYLLKITTINIIKYMLNNFEYICYFWMLMNHMTYASLLSMVWPFAVFAYALIEYPRPKFRFWKICLIYTSCILMVKFILQLGIMKLMSAEVTTELNNIFAMIKLGFKVHKDPYSGAFLYYIVFDALLILFIMMQEYFMIARGMWEKIEPEMEPLEEAYDRIYKTKTILDEKMDDYTKEIYNQIKTDTAKRSMISDKVIIPQKRGACGEYYHKLFPEIRNYKPGKDFYTFYTVIAMLLVLFIILFYTKMDRNVIYTTTIKTRQFSGMMVLVAFFMVFVCVLDRIIYNRQNRNNVELNYVYYNKINGERAGQNEDIQNNPDLYFPIYYQKEPTNQPLICKYILQIVIILASHAFIFYYLPMVGTVNLQNSVYCAESLSDKAQCNNFPLNGYLIAFYLFFCVYLFFSSLQIHYGLLDMRKKSLLMRKDNIIYSSLFKTYKAIPFLYELKLTIDWTFTPTSLDLFKWIKFESVYDILFITHCTMKAYQKRPVGLNIGWMSKMLLGGSSFVILLLIIIGPLLLFSTLNPTNVKNNVTGANIEVFIYLIY